MSAPVNTPHDPASELIDLSDYARLAQSKMTPMAWAYISGGAGDEITLRENTAAYDRLRLRPRVLTDVSQLDTSVGLLGRTHACPILLAPLAYQKLAHPEGEAATARGAATAGVTMVVGTSANIALEDVATSAGAPKWFQLYVQPGRLITEQLVRRAEAAGYEAIVLTVDSPVLGPRHREARAKFTLPEGLERANHRGLVTAQGGHRGHGEATSIYTALLDPTLTWKDVSWLVGFTKLPVLIKGVLTGDDARRGVEAGVAGVVVSNHGGRNLDTVPATIDALPEVAAAVAGRVSVLVDGGIRRGTDVLKAVARGATAVLIGRPYVYGLAVDGAAGVARVVTLLRREFEMAMALTGRRTLAEIDSSVIWSSSS